MWFFAAVLVLWGSTFELARWDAWVLSPVTQWAWWTFNLYVCGIAAATGSFTSLAERLMALLGYSMVVIYYLTLSDTYLEFLPTDAGQPDLWPSVFLTVNLLGPLLVTTVGLAAQGVQRDRR